MKIPGIFRAIENKEWGHVQQLSGDANKKSVNGEYPLLLMLKQSAPADLVIKYIESFQDAIGESKSILEIALANGYGIDVIEALLSKSPSLATAKNSVGQFPLTAAILAGNTIPSAVIELISSKYPEVIIDKDESDLSAFITMMANAKTPRELVYWMCDRFPKGIRSLLDWAYDAGKLYLCIAAYLVLFDLPIAESGKPKEHHGFSFTWLLDLDAEKLPLALCEDVVESVFVKHSNIVFQLAESEDIKGRPALNIPHKTVKRTMTQHLLFLGRYDMGSGAPEHQSLTCVLRLAVDKKTDSWKHVALKFMKHKDQFEREIECRKLLTDGQLDSVVSSDFVIGLTEKFDSPEFIAAASKRKGFESYPYCVVMPAADRNLKAVLDHEHIAGKDWFQVKFILTQIANCLDFMHSKHMIHGDLKPLNVMRSLGRYKLIDMDASVSFREDNPQDSGAKYSSAFIPPELVHIDSNGIPVVKTYSIDDNNQVRLYGDYKLVRAHPAHDVWSFGILAYQICTDKTLFHSNGQDNLDNAGLMDLYNWTNEYRDSKMASIEDPLAKNLLTQILQKDPSRRPSIKRILAHSFLTGKKAARIAGESAEFDVFLSYRVSSDSDHIEMLYDRLVAKGLKVWWDKKCLKKGENWEDGFCDGLAKSMSFVALLSQDAINHMENPKQSFGKLLPSSECDNVLLEHRLALELQRAGLIEKVFPIMIGKKDYDIDGGTVYGHYFRQNCAPHLSPGIVVEAVERKLGEHLDRLTLGSPVIPNMPVKAIFEELTRNQGVFVVGKQAQAFDEAAHEIDLMIKEIKGIRGAAGTGSLAINTMTPKTVQRVASSPTSPSGPAKAFFPSPAPPSTDKPTEDQRSIRQAVSEDKLALRALKEVLKAKDMEIEELTKEVTKVKFLYSHANSLAAAASHAAVDK